MIKLDEPLLRFAAQGRPAPMSKLKDSLAQLPPQEAYDIYRSSLNLFYDRTVLRRTKAMSQQARAKARAKRYIETAPPGIPFVNKAPKVIGEGNARDLVWKTRTAYVACFENARVWGGSAVIDADEEALFDFEDWELASSHDRLYYDQRVFRSKGDDIYYIADADKAPDIVVDRAFPLLGPHTRSFGDWLWQYLPKFAAAIQTGHLPPLTVLIEDYIPSSQKEAIEQLLPSGTDLLSVKFNACVRARELWCAPSIVYMPIWPSFAPFNGDCEASHPERFKSAIKAMNAAFPLCSGVRRTGRRLFFSRRHQPRRQMLNWQEIETLCSGFGFDIVIPESLAFSEQVAAIRSADYVAGPEGSAFFLCYYARPGTKTCIFSHPELIGAPPLTAVLEGLGVDCLYFTGPFASINPVYLWWSDYTIERERFASFLTEWCGIGQSTQANCKGDVPDNK